MFSYILKYIVTLWIFYIKYIVRSEKLRVYKIFCMEIRKSNILSEVMYDGSTVSSC